MRGDDDEFPFYCVARDADNARDIAVATYPDGDAGDVEEIE